MLTTAVTLPPARIGARRPGPGRSFYSLPMQATDLQKELAATVRKFVKTELPNSLVEKIDREDKAPTRELFAKMGELGLHGVMAHPDYGGLGLGYTEHCLIVEQLSRGCPAIGLAYGAHSNLCMSQIIRNGSAAQKKRFLPKLISGEAVGALAITEPDAGTDAFAMRTTARKAADGSHYVLNGTKTFITNAGVADTYVVYAKTRPDLGHNGVSCFVVEKGAPGLSFGPKFEKLGMRGCETRQVIFENCKVPAANLISQENKGNMAMKLGLNSERLVLSAGPLGIMSACLDAVIPYVKTRKQFGKPIGRMQLIQGKLADMYTRLMASRELVYAAARAADSGNMSPSLCASAILFSAESATKVALDAVQCLGGYGYMSEYPVARLLRDAKLYEIGAGTSEIRRIVIAKDIIKKPLDI